MIRYYLFFTFAVMLVMLSCRSRKSSDQLIKTQVDSSITVEGIATDLKATLSMKDKISASEPIELKFTVSNATDSTQRFCKWHTPFEPFLSMYLEITDSNRKEVAYIGAMAKRIMPPPADAYISVPAGNLVSATVDLSKGYAITEPGTYHVRFRGQQMSGLQTANELKFVLVR